MKELLILLQSRNKMIFFVLSSIILILSVAWMKGISIPYFKVIGILILTCLINAIFLIIIKQKRCLKTVTYMQPVVNILLITMGVHFSGGIESVFIYAYLMLITGEAIRAGIKRGYVFAVISLLCYGTVIALESSGSISHIHTSDFFAEDAFKNISFFTVSYVTTIVFLVAFLSGHLSQVVRHILKTKNDELALANQRITAATNLLQAVFNNMSEGVISVDVDQTVLLANTKSSDLLNIAEKDIISKPLELIFSETPLSSAIKQALKKEKTVSCQIEILSNEKEPRILLAKIAPLKDKGESSSEVVIVFQDISIEKRFFAIKASLLSIFSHELRTPLTSIMAYTEMLLENVTKEKDTEFLQIISEETNRLNVLIESFISFAKMELKSFTLKKELISVSKLIDDLVGCVPRTHSTEIKKLAEKKNILLSCEIVDKEITVFGDQAQLKKAMEYILDNAIKFTPKKGKVAVSVKSDIESVEIRVTDTGIGIDPAKHTKIFEPFYQIDPLITRATGGMGMGLAMAKGIIEAHGGEISVESCQGKGSTFVVTMPVQQVLYVL